MRKCKPQDECVVRTVRVVASTAVALNHRTMLKTSLFPYLFILMAFKTEIIDLILQQIRIVRIMGGVTLNTFTLIRRRMLFGILADLVLLSLMARQAQFVRLGLKPETVLPSVGVMTISTARLDKRFMHKLLCHSGDHIIVTKQTEIGTAISKARLVVRRVHVMAEPAVPVLYGLMY